MVTNLTDIKRLQWIIRRVQWLKYCLTRSLSLLWTGFQPVHLHLLDQYLWRPLQNSKVRGGYYRVFSAYLHLHPWQRWDECLHQDTAVAVGDRSHVSRYPLVPRRMRTLTVTPTHLSYREVCPQLQHRHSPHLDLTHHALTQELEFASSSTKPAPLE